jgi:Xylose isomerase-like TIM barrel
MKRSIATVSLSGTLEDKLRAIAAAGFDGVEIFENDLVNSGASPRQIHELAQDVGLTIELFQPFRDLEGVPDDLFRRNLDRLQRKFDVMAELNAPMLLVCSNVSSNALAEPDRAAEQLHATAELAANRNIRLAYEALAWGRHVRTTHKRGTWYAAPTTPRSVCASTVFTLALARSTRHRAHSRRSDLFPAARGCAEAADGRAVVESPLPLFSRPGRAGCRWAPGASADERLPRAAAAGGFQ